jgi:hypothetical protein
MTEQSDTIIEACRRVIEAYEAYLAADKECQAWLENEEECGLGSIRVRYEFRHAQLTDARAEAGDDYQTALSHLKTLLL